MASRPPLWRQPLSLLVLALMLAAPVLFLAGPRLLGIATFWAGMLVGGVVLSRAPRRADHQQFRTERPRQ